MKPSSLFRNAFAAALLAASIAAIPSRAVAGFTYQGAVKDVAGSPLTGQKTVQFRLYEQATGGSPLWGRSRAVLLNENGQFNVELSDATGDAIPNVPSTGLDALLSASSGTTLYVGLTVIGSDGEVAPRQRLLSVPYASFAGDVANATRDFTVAKRLSAGGLAVGGQATVSGQATFKRDAAVKGNLAVAGKILGPGTRSAYGTLPLGSIVIWSGTANRIPDGWTLCDGSNGTPDLRGRFVVGYHPSNGDYSVGKTGGEKTHTISTDEMPSHSHDVPVSIWGYHLTRGDLWEFMAPSSYYTSHQTSISSSSVGGGRAHENSPPYYALCYIMRVK